MDTHRLRHFLGSLVLVAGAVLIAAPAQADPVRVFAAGSLVGPMKEIIAASGIPAAAPVFGPAGLLRQRLEGGEHADLFASADMAQPQHLADKGLAIPPVPFANNRMCVASKGTVGLTSQNLLDRLLAPDFRLATSTPVADPGGDHAEAVFDRADAIRPGAASVLRHKALRLLGAPNTMVPVAGKSPAAAIFLTDRADALLYYCSGAPGTMKEVPGLVSLPLPDTLAVKPVYGLTVLRDSPDAMKLALFILSAKGQAILARWDYLPINP